MSGEDPKEPEVDVVEKAHEAGSFTGMREAQRDTEDASWDKGVFAGQSDQTAPLPKATKAEAEAKADADFIPQLRKQKTGEQKALKPAADDEEEEDEELSPALMFAVGVGGSSLMMVLAYSGLSLAGAV